MAGEWNFNDVTFDFVYQDRVGPAWKPELDATDRRLIGTERFERTWRSTRWVLQGDCFIEPGPTATLTYEVLLSSFALSSLATLTDGESSWQAVIVDFQVLPIRIGTEGYRGSLTFARPLG